jgi:ubiquinone biosynthesis protein COQ9
MVPDAGFTDEAVHLAIKQLGYSPALAATFTKGCAIELVHFAFEQHNAELVEQFQTMPDLPE